MSKMHRMPHVAGLFLQKAIMYRAFLQKMTYKDKPSYALSPPCSMRVYRNTEIAILRF